MSDKEQRDLAEKIRQENLQQEKAALEALKKQENTDQEEEGIKVHHLLITSCRGCMISRFLFCCIFASHSRDRDLRLLFRKISLFLFVLVRCGLFFFYNQCF